MAEQNQPIPVETDFPIGGPTPEGTIVVEGDTKASEAQLSTSSLRAAQNRIEGTDNPDILSSTPGDDLVLAKGGNDTILGSLGNDTYNGGDGFDTLDYTDLGRKITLLPRGIVGNGDSQGTQYQEIEKIIGAPGKDNTIDGSGGTTDAFFTINLAEQLARVENVPGLGSLQFEVENFVNVEGTENSDSIIGNDDNNKLSGNAGNDSLVGKLGNDTLSGGSGNDTLTGTDPELQNVKAEEQDLLTGGTGSDKFVLGNKSGSFYDDLGNNDFASITDFSFGDKIQLGSGETYNIERNKGGFDIFLIEDSGKDLIGKVALSLGISNARNTSNAKMTTDSVLTETSANSLLGELPEGDFIIDSGEQKGVFVA